MVMQPVQTKSSFLQKQIPTLVGVVVLVGAMIAGLFMFSEGTGVFAPRATPQTTPKQVKITNVADKAFTISFYTDEATAGFVKYGTTDKELSLQASDDRDQLSGSVGKYTLHHITLKGLKPNSQYFFTLGTGSGTVYDNNGSPFNIKTTTEVSGPPPVSKTVYGSVNNAGGTPADGSVVYLAIEGHNEMSALVKPSGSWAISLSNARTKAEGTYASLKDEDILNVFVQGIQLAQTTQTTVALKNAQPVADLALGAGGSSVAETVPTPETTVEPIASSSSLSASSLQGSATGSGELSNEQDVSTESTGSSQVAADLAAGLGGTENGSVPTQTPTEIPTPTVAVISSEGLESTSTEPTPVPTSARSTQTAVSSASAVLNLSEIAVGQTVVTGESPKIVGQAPPRTQIKIEVHSDTEIIQTVTTTDGGTFELDLSQYQNLDPGEHTVTITYTDPQTGNEVSKVQTFIVEDKSLLALAAGQGGNTPPFGSGNPYPITTPTPTTSSGTIDSATDSAGTGTDTSTRSAVVSTTSGTYNSGSVGLTFALVGGGLFFILTGLWSGWLAGKVREA